MASEEFTQTEPPVDTSIAEARWLLAVVGAMWLMPFTVAIATY